MILRRAFENEKYKPRNGFEINFHFIMYDENFANWSRFKKSFRKRKSDDFFLLQEML